MEAAAANGSVPDGMPDNVPEVEVAEIETVSGGLVNMRSVQASPGSALLAAAVQTSSHSPLISMPAAHNYMIADLPWTCRGQCCLVSTDWSND